MNKLIAISLLFILFATTANASLCDIDADNDIDRDDISLIFSALGSTATANDPRDADHDQFISFLDGRQCVMSCTLPTCESPNHNSAPIAEAGDDQSILVGNTAFLDGGQSFDADGDALTFHWILGSSPPGSLAQLSSGTTMTPTFTPDIPGRYILRLIVNDSVTDSTADIVTISASSEITLRESFSAFGKLGAGLQLSYRLILGSDQHGGITVRISSSDTRLALISNDAGVAGSAFIDVFIPHGQRTHDFMLQGVNPHHTGTVTINASAPFFHEGLLDIAIVTPALAIDNLAAEISKFSADDEFSVRTGVPNQDNTGVLNQAVSIAAGDLTLNLSSSHPLAGQITSELSAGMEIQTTIAAGYSLTPLSLTTGGVAFDPLDTGKTTVSVHADGFDDAFPRSQQHVTVIATSSLSLREAFTSIQQIGAGLQTTYRLSLDASDHGGITARIRSHTPDIAVVSTHETLPGSEVIDVFIPNGSRHYDFSVQGASPLSTGTARLSASAPAFGDATIEIPFVPPVLAINHLQTELSMFSANDPFTVRTGVSNTQGNGIVAQAVSLASGDLNISLESSASAYGQLETLMATNATLNIVISAGSSRSSETVADGGVAFDPVNAGTTSISARAEGFDQDFTLAHQQVTVLSNSTLSLREAFSSFGQLGAGLQLIYRVFLGASEHGGTTVRIMTSDAHLAVVSADETTRGNTFVDLFIANGDTTADFVLQSIDSTRTGTLQLTATATAFTDAEMTVPLVPAVLEVAGLQSSITTSADNDLFVIRTGIPNYRGTAVFAQSVSMAHGDLTITLSSSDANVGQFVSELEAGEIIQTTVPAGQTQTAHTLPLGGIAFDPLTTGETMITARSPGFDSQNVLSNKTVTVSE